MRNVFLKIIHLVWTYIIIDSKFDIIIIYNTIRDWTMFDARAGLTRACVCACLPAHAQNKGRVVNRDGRASAVRFVRARLNTRFSFWHFHEQAMGKINWNV